MLYKNVNKNSLFFSDPHEFDHLIAHNTEIFS